MAFTTTAYVMFYLVLAFFVVIFAFMGIRLLIKVIGILSGWNNGKRNPRR